MRDSGRLLGGGRNLDKGQIWGDVSYEKGWEWGVGYEGVLRVGWGVGDGQKGRYASAGGGATERRTPKREKNKNKEEERRERRVCEAARISRGRRPPRLINNNASQVSTAQRSWRRPMNSSSILFCSHPESRKEIVIPHRRALNVDTYKRT